MRRPLGDVLVGPDKHLFHVAVAHEDLRRARLDSLLQARAEFVAARIRIHPFEHPADGAAHEVLRDLRAVLVPVGLHEAQFRLLAQQPEARIDPELAHDRPDLLRIALHHEPALVGVAIEAHVLEPGQHDLRRRRGRRAGRGLLRVSRIRGLRARIRDRVAVVHRRRGELGRNLERLRGACLGALVLVLVAEERATREKRERENGQNAKPRHETVSFSMQPASRSAASSAS